MATPEGWPAGVGRVALDCVDSTNEEARRRAGAGDRGPLWISAARQTAARGSRGRSWSTEDGALAATCLMPWTGRPAREAALMSFCACLAVADMLAALAPLARVALKWPNDALLNDRKVAGVLLESAGDGRGVGWLAVGVGVNLAAAPPAEPGGWEPTSVRAETGAAPDPDAALTLLASALARWSDTLAAQGFGPVRAAWLARATRLGAPITVRLPRETLPGVFADLAEDGALVLNQDGATRRIHAADVFFS